MTSSEVATYFGPSDSPLFGVLHLPEEKQIRGGVLICSSLGKEGMDGIRFERILANDLADLGFGVLRFDYLGTGDSAFAQDRDDAIGNWRSSIEYAVEYLTEVGARSITAVALRAGSLILGDVLGELSGIDRVVYVDPVGTGRRYLREQTVMFTMVVGDDSAPTGTVSTIGARLSGVAAAEFRALSLVGAPPQVDQLLVLRSGPMDAQTSALAESAAVRSVTVDGLAEFAEVAQTLRPMPLAAVDAVVDWIDEATSTANTLATPKYVASAKIPVEGSGHGDIVECIESIGPTGLFAIRTRPEDVAPGVGKVVLFCGTANDAHFGPGREWVELSRRTAQAGAQALRWDRSGADFAGPVSRDQWRPIYSEQGIAEAIAAAKHAATDARNLQIAGICSGSWYAAQAARASGSTSVILISPLVWEWRIRGTRLWQWHTKKTLLARMSDAAAVESTSVERWRHRIVEAAIPARDALKLVAHRYTPRWALKLLGRLGVAQLPEVILGTLAQNGTTVTLLLAPEDAEVFDRKRGHSELERWKQSPAAPQLITPPVGDHTAYHWAMLEGIRETVLNHALQHRHTHTLTSGMQ